MRCGRARARLFVHSVHLLFTWWHNSSIIKKHLSFIYTYYYGARSTPCHDSGKYNLDLFSCTLPPYCFRTLRMWLASFRCAFIAAFTSVSVLRCQRIWAMALFENGKWVGWKVFPFLCFVATVVAVFLHEDNTIYKPVIMSVNASVLQNTADYILQETMLFFFLDIRSTMEFYSWRQQYFWNEIFFEQSMSLKKWRAVSPFKKHFMSDHISITTFDTWRWECWYTCSTWDFL